MLANQRSIQVHAARKLNVWKKSDKYQKCFSVEVYQWSSSGSCKVYLKTLAMEVCRKFFFFLEKVEKLIDKVAWQPTSGEGRFEAKENIFVFMNYFFFRVTSKFFMQSSCHIVCKLLKFCTFLDIWYTAGLLCSRFILN